MVVTAPAVRGWRTDEPWKVAGTAAFLMGLFLVVRLLTTHGPGGFPVAGAPYTHTGAAAELRLYPHAYDGQFVYRLALNPFTRLANADGITLDLPGYRQQRIMTAVFAYLIALLPGISTAVALMIVNLSAVGVALRAAIGLVADLRRSLWWAPLLAIPACLPISVGRDLNEPVAWAAILTGLLLARRRRWFLASVALTLAVLARETSLLVVAGLGLETLLFLVRGRLRLRPTGEQVSASRLWLALPLAVEGGWQLWLAHVWGGRLPILSGPGNNSSSKPVLSLFQHFFDGIPAHSIAQLGLGVTYAVERGVLVLLIAASLWALLRQRTKVSVGEAVAWALCTLIALSLRQWGNDVAFLRATYECWGLSVLLLLATPLRAPLARAALQGAGLVTIGVTTLYAVRV